jgi:hypothetical protein
LSRFPGSPKVGAIPYAGCGNTRTQVSGLADGWHRIARAVLEGVAELPAYLLTQEASDAYLLLYLPSSK